MGEATPRHRQAADDRYWRLSRRAAGVLGLLWLAVWLLPALFARDLDFTFFGAPFAIWACSQGIPIVFLLIVWRYERRMDRLDRQYRDECRDDRDA